ncbi:MAG TPA: VanZ family protein [Bacteroidales bacterium]|nr:VanZ family protein [Bacteroidales bacterium]
MSRRTLLLIYLIAIVVLVAIPVGNENVKSLNSIFLLRLRGDYIVHMLLFVPWCFLKPGLDLSKWWWLLAGVAFALAAESLQYFIPYRAFNINDMIANALGVVLSFILVSIWQLRVSIKKERGY